MVLRMKDCGVYEIYLKGQDDDETEGEQPRNQRQGSDVDRDVFGGVGVDDIADVGDQDDGLHSDYNPHIE
jgi:hypothetical protein